LIAGSSFPAAAADKRVVFEIQLKISFSCWKWALDCGNNHNCSEILDVRHKERDFLCFFFFLLTSKPPATSFVWQGRS
jgi:hypothetical protein